MTGGPWHVENDWPDGMKLLGELMDAVGVPNDGVSSPKALWERSIEKARLYRARYETTNIAERGGGWIDGQIR